MNLKNYSEEEIIALIDSMKNGKIGYTLMDLKTLQAEANNRRLPAEYPGVIAELLRKALQNNDGKNTSTSREDLPHYGDTMEVLNPDSMKEIKNILDNMPKVDIGQTDEAPATFATTREAAERIKREYNLNVPSRENSKAGESTGSGYAASGTATASGTSGTATASRVSGNTAKMDKVQSQKKRLDFFDDEDEEYTPPKKGTNAKIDYSQELLEDYADEKYPVLCFLTSFLKVVGWIALVINFINFGYVATVFGKTNMIIVLLALFGAILVSGIELLIFYSSSENISLKLDIERHLRD